MNMPQQSPTDQALRADNAELRARLEEAEEMLRAIRAGEVDALVVDGNAGPQLFTLQGLDAEQNRFRGEMLAQVSDAVIAVNLEERITYLNAAAERQYGVRASDMLGCKLGDMYTMHWPSPEQEAAARSALREDGKWHGEYLQRTHHGRELHIDSSMTVLRNSYGETIGRLSVIRDITDRKLAEEMQRQSQERVRLASEAAEIGIWSWWPDEGSVIWENEYPYRILGVSLSSPPVTATRFVAEFLHPEDLPAFEQAIARTVQAHEPFNFSGRIRKPDGEMRWIEFMGKWEPVKGTGAPRVIGTVQDVTTRKLADEALRERAHFLQKIAQITPGVLHVFDLVEKHTLFLNRTVASLLDYSPKEAEAMGTNMVPTLIHPEDLPRFEQHVSRACALADGQVADFEHRMRDRAGEWHWFHRQDAVFARDATGAPRQLIGVATEVTERKRAEESLRQNAALFSALIAQAPMGTYVVDAEFRVRQVNAEAMPAFFSAQPVIGRDFQEVMEILWGPEVGARCADIFRHTLETGERYISPPFTEQRHDLGIEQTYEWETQRVTLPDGQHGVVCYFNEVTERVRTTEALRASEQRMRLATEATQVGIWEWNVVTNQIRWDAQMFRIYGIAPTPDGFIDYTDWSGAVLPEDLAQNEAILQDTLRRCGQSERTFRIRRRNDGECRHVVAVDTVRMNAQGQAEWVVGTNLDITDRNEKAEALHASEERYRVLASHLEYLVKERTEELVQSQDRLRALATELNLAEHRERKRLADELHDYLAQLLVLCRLNLGQIKPIGLPPKAEEKVHDTDEVLTKALNYCRTLMAELSPPVLHEHGLSAALGWLGEQMALRGLSVRVDTGGAAGMRLPGDTEVLLFQSVRELLLNALKYAECRDVAVRMEQADGRLRLEICDDGVGFDVGAADSYGTTAMSSKFGLFSIRERMKSLGGWFDLTSSPGKGTTAVLAIALGRAEVKALNAEPFRGAESRSDHSARRQQDMTQIRVLLVDDHAMVRQGLRNVLEEYDDVMVVGEASNGAEALDQVETLRPSMVVMDINMPKMNGIEATAAIKARYPDISVIGLSVQAGGVNEESMKQAGAVTLLTKEAAVEDLYRTIQEALARDP